MWETKELLGLFVLQAIAVISRESKKVQASDLAIRKIRGPLRIVEKTVWRGSGEILTWSYGQRAHYQPAPNVQSDRCKAICRGRPNTDEKNRWNSSGKGT